MLSAEVVSIILQFEFATLLPVFASVAFTFAFRRKSFASMGYWQRQVLCGVVFGVIAIFGTEFGIDTNGATMNVRDAAPIVSGLYFGGPSGIIAGLIGGIERWFSVLWGRGMYTRVACSVATIAVGFYAALLNRYLFSDRKPTWPLALAIGMVAEVLHLLLVFLTNMDDATRAFYVVQKCTAPMIICNGLSVALSGAVIALLHGQKIFRAKRLRDISQVIQAGMLGVVAVGFVATVGFTFVLQHNIVVTDAHDTLAIATADAQEDIRDASDANLLSLTRQAAQRIPSVDAAKDIDLEQLARELNVSEVNIVDDKGMVAYSSDPSIVGFDMSSGEQSRAFLILLPGVGSTSFTQEYQPKAADATVWRKYSGVSIPGGFVQLGYDSSQFLGDIASQVQASVRNRHVGKDGFFLVLGEGGKIAGLGDRINLADVNPDALMQQMATQEVGTMFRVDVHGVRYFAMYADVEGFRIVALLPLIEAVQARDLAVLVTSYMEVIVFAALFIAIYVLIRHVVVNSIWQVNGTLNQITSGDLEARVDVRASTEFSTLSDDINRTVAALRDAIAAEGRRIEADLATAKAIQESALPRTFPPFPDIDAFNIYASMNAAREVGGDFYDFFLIDDHTLGFLIADVSGKGIPASLFMMAAKSELANYMRSGMDLAEAVHSANRDLCQGNDAGMFVTVWAATLDYNNGLLTYVNAGHNPPLLRHEHTWQWLKNKGGLFLGTFETARYRSSTMTLVPGDELLLYTDGVNEAFNTNEEEYGNDRLEAFLSAHANLHPHMLIDMLRADLRNWSTGAEQSDDITMLCLEYGVPPEVTGSMTVPATNEGLHELSIRMHYELSQLQCPEFVQTQIDLTVEELFTNICQHGYLNSAEPGDIAVSFTYNADPSSIVVSLTDWGEPFNPLTYERSEDDDMVTGMGVTLALGRVDDAAYVRDGDCNVIAFRKNW